jgi:hypothetical protein
VKAWSVLHEATSIYRKRLVMCSTLRSPATVLPPHKLVDEAPTSSTRRCAHESPRKESPAPRISCYGDPNHPHSTQVKAAEEISKERPPRCWKRKPDRSVNPPEPMTHGLHKIIGWPTRRCAYRQNAGKPGITPALIYLLDGQARFAAPAACRYHTSWPM